MYPNVIDYIICFQEPDVNSVVDNRLVTNVDL